MSDSRSKKSFMQILEGCCKNPEFSERATKLYDALQKKMENFTPPIDEKNEIHPNNIWQILWDKYDLKEEAFVSDIEKYIRNRITENDIFKNHVERKCLAIAEALVNTPIVGNEINDGRTGCVENCLAEKDGKARNGWHRMVETISNTQLDQVSYLVNTVPLSDQRREEIVPNKYGLIKNKLSGADSNLAFYGYLRPLKIIDVMIDIRKKIVNGLEHKEKSPDKPLPENAVQIDQSFEGWMKLHKLLHEEIYDFAGQTREIDMCKFSNWNSRCFDAHDPNIDWQRVDKEVSSGAIYVVFDKSEHLFEEGQKILSGLGSIIDKSTDEPDKNIREYAFADAIASPFMQINALHPTREGTSITSQLFFYSIAQDKGIDFKWKYEKRTGLTRYDAIMDWEKSGRVNHFKMTESIYANIQYATQRNERFENDPLTKEKQLLNNSGIVISLVKKAKPAMSRGLGLVYAKSITNKRINESTVKWLGEEIYDKDSDMGEQISPEELKLLWDMHLTIPDNMKDPSWNNLVAKATLDYILFGSAKDENAYGFIADKIHENSMLLSLESDFSNEFLHRGHGFNSHGVDLSEDNLSIASKLNEVIDFFDYSKEQRHREAREIEDKEYAVLIPILEINNEPHVIFTQRSSHISYADDYSFPGGKKDETDSNIVITALRETEEEIRLPREEVKIIEQLEPLHTMSGRKTNPVIGYIASEGIMQELQASEWEVNKILAIPLNDLLKAKESFDKGDIAGEGTRIEHYFYNDNPRQQYVVEHPEGGSVRIYGITADIINSFLEKYPSIEVVNKAIDALDQSAGKKI